LHAPFIPAVVIGVTGGSRGCRLYATLHTAHAAGWAWNGTPPSPPSPCLPAATPHACPTPPAPPSPPPFPTYLPPLPTLPRHGYTPGARALPVPRHCLLTRPATARRRFPHHNLPFGTTCLRAAHLQRRSYHLPYARHFPFWFMPFCRLPSPTRATPHAPSHARAAQRLRAARHACA